MNDIGIRSPPVVGERMETVGVDWGPKGIVLVYREGDFGIYKIPGHSAWVSHFSPWQYRATRYGIVKFGRRSTWYWGEIDLIYKSDVTPGAAWRSAISNLKEEVQALAAGEVGILDTYGLLEKNSE